MTHKRFLIFLIFFCCIANSYAVITIERPLQQSSSSEQKVSSHKVAQPLKSILEVEYFPISPLVSKYYQLSLTELEQAKQQTNVLQAAKVNFNPAEAFLFYSAEARIALSAQNNNEVVALLEQALNYDKEISKRQLANPKFYNSYLLLAEEYAKQEQYKLAYETENKYFRKLKMYMKQKKQAMAANLDVKYEMATKQQTNLALEASHELEANKLSSLDQDQLLQRQFVFLMLAVFVAFAILVTRQFRLKNKLAHLSQTDSLTQLYNRDSLLKVGQRLLLQLDSQAVDVSVILLDLDYFKQVNNQYGYTIGDSVLKQVAELTGEVMRSRDILARVGGEEFFIVLPEVQLDEAKAIAERLREKISSYQFSSGKGSFQITASFGVAAMTQTGSDINTLMQVTNNAIEQAKQKNGNRVICFMPE